MFKDNNIDISRQSAILLHYGIISNRVNLKSKVTTNRDIQILIWLKEECSEIDGSLIAKIFDVYKEYQVDYVFINIIDILSVYHLLYACDDNSKLFFRTKFKYRYE